MNSPIMKVNPKVRLSKTLGLNRQEMLMRNHTVMRKAIDPPMDHKSDQELDKGRDTQVITDRTMMESEYRSDAGINP